MYETEQSLMILYPTGESLLSVDYEGERGTITQEYYRHKNTEDDDATTVSAVLCNIFNAVVDFLA
tara:strand:- start:25648 stop:25842 length:195 start_codon:yes stop_codon:yes gene_type:complete